MISYRIVKHQQLFSTNIAKMGESNATLYVKPDATPKFCYPCKVPFVLEDAIRNELRRLEEDIILKPILDSDWASPIVIFSMSGGEVRICGDFKRTINPFTDIEQISFA